MERGNEDLRAALARAEARGQVRRPAARNSFSGGGHARWLPAVRPPKEPQVDAVLSGGRAVRVKHFFSVVFACRRWFLVVQWGSVAMSESDAPVGHVWPQKCRVLPRIMEP